MSKNSAAVFASRIAYPGCYQCCLQVPAWTRPGVGTTCLPKSLNIFLRRYRLAPLANIDGFLERQIADLEQLVTRRIIANHVILEEESLPSPQTGRTLQTAQVIDKGVKPLVGLLRTLVKDLSLATCASSMYALRDLRTHGLPPQSFHEVAKMTAVSSLMNAFPAWWGFTSARYRKRIGAFLARMK